MSSVIAHNNKVVLAPKSGGGRTALTFDELLADINEATGENDITLFDAVNTLINGYGQDSEEVYYTSGGVPYYKNMVFPDSVDSSPDTAFQNATYIEQLEWTADLSGVTFNTDQIFRYCSNIKSFRMPKPPLFGPNLSYLIGMGSDVEEVIIGSVGHPYVGETSFNTALLNNSSARPTITFYLNISSLDDLPDIFQTGSPWGCENATIVYRSSVTGEVLS